MSGTSTGSRTRKVSIDTNPNNKWTPIGSDTSPVSNTAPTTSPKPQPTPPTASTASSVVSTSVARSKPKRPSTSPPSSNGNLGNKSHRSGRSNKMSNNGNNGHMTANGQKTSSAKPSNGHIAHTSSHTANSTNTNTNTNTGSKRRSSRHHVHHTHHHNSRHSLFGMLLSPSLFPSRRLARWILRVMKVAAALNLFRAIPFFVLEIYYLMALVLVTAFALFAGYQGTHPVPRIRPLILYAVGSTMSAFGDLSILVLNRGKWTTTVPEVSTFQEACWDAYIVLVCAVVVTDLLGTILALALARSVWQSRQWDAKAVAQWLATHQHHHHNNHTRLLQGVATKMRMIYNPGLLADVVKAERVQLVKQRAQERRLEAERIAAGGTPRPRHDSSDDIDESLTDDITGDMSHPLARTGAPRVTLVKTHTIDVVPTEEKSLIEGDATSESAVSSLSSSSSTITNDSTLLLPSDSTSSFGHPLGSSSSDIDVASLGLDDKSPQSGEESPTSPRSQSSGMLTGTRTPKLDKARDTDMTHFHDNSIHKARYNPLTFLPLFLYAQFSRLANLYTLCIVIFSLFDFSPIGPLSSITPLMFVLTTSALKELLEDWKRRKADNEINARPAHILTRDGDEAEFKYTSWFHVKVGDVIRVKKGEVLPADLIFISSASEVGICYIETSNLDGETDLKIRTCLTETAGIRSAEQAGRLRFLIECEQPNNNLYNFDGRITMQASDGTEKTLPVPLHSILLRGTQLRTTAYVYGIVINTGVDTKVEQNSTQGRNKRSAVEKGVNSMLMVLFLLQMLICFLCSLGHNGWRMKPEPGYPEPWYIQNIDERQYIFMSYIIIYNTMIPLSLYVSMELSRAVNGRHINQDKLMYDPVSKVQSQARNTNIVEELGAIKYVFTDKTGTLTCNQMVFVQCSIAGIRYGHDEAARRKYSSADDRPPASPHFNDASLVDRLHNGHATASSIHDFMLVLSLCNTVQPENASSNWGSAAIDDEADNRSRSSSVSTDSSDRHSRTNSLTSAQAQAVADAVNQTKSSLAEVAIAIEGKTAARAAAVAAGRDTPPFSARRPSAPYPYHNHTDGVAVAAAGTFDTESFGMDGERPDGRVPTTGDDTPTGHVGGITITGVDGETKSLASLRGQYGDDSKRDTDVSGMSSSNYGSTDTDHAGTGATSSTPTMNGNGVSDDKITYQADSPDEFAMVTTARGLGYQLRSRVGRHLVVRVNGVDESYEVLNTLAFTSRRKRMSVILRCPDGRIQLYCKGADEVIGPRLVSMSENMMSWDATQDHLTEFAQDGLRTMVSAGVVLDEARYDDWNKRYHAATVNLNVEQGKADIEMLCEEIESDMTLIGATAVEDKLQEGVPETIESLRRGGIKVWTLTGDKQETAMSIGSMSRVLTEDMEVLVLQENMTEDELSAALDRIIIDHSLRLSPHFVEKKTGKRRQTNRTASGGMGSANTATPGLLPLPASSAANIPVVSLSSHATTSTIREDIAIRVSPDRPQHSPSSMTSSSSLAVGGDHSPVASPRHANGSLHVTTLEESKTPMGMGVGLASPGYHVASPFNSPLATPGSMPGNRRMGIKRSRHTLDALDNASPSPRLGPSLTMVSPPSPMSLPTLADQPSTPVLSSLASLSLASLRGIRSPSLGDRYASDVPQRPLALVCSGSTLATALPQSVTGDEDDLDDLSVKFFAVAKACVSVICYRCTPMQKSTAVRTVSERSVLWGDGAITLAIGDGANDVPMLLQAHVGVGMSGNEGMQAVLASDFSIPRFHMLQRLLLVHGYRSNKRMSILILYSVFKNLGLCLPQFWFSFWSGFSGQLLYFDFLFTMFNSLFTALPILAVTMFDTDASDDTLTKNHRGNALYMTAGGRSGKVGEFLRWLFMGFWMSFVVFIVPFASLSDVPASDGSNIGMWGEGLACYTYLIVSCQLQIALHTKQWSKSNIIAMTVSSVSYIVFVLVLTTFTLTEFGLVWMQQSAYGVLRELLSLPAFWLGLILAPTISILPGFVYEASVQLFNPPLAYQLSLAERERKQALQRASATGGGVTGITAIATGITSRRPLAYERLE